MMTEKIRVSASSVINSVDDTSATPAICRAEAGRSVMRESVPSRFTMDRSSVQLRRAFSAAAVLWAVALPSAAMVASLRAPAFPGYLSALAVYAIGSIVCHQLPDRSFYLWGRQLPVCARCMGIYVGAALVAVFVAIARLKPRPSTLLGATLSRSKDRAPAVRLKPRVVWAGLAVSPTLLTFGYEWTAGTAPANWIRAAAGFMLGTVVSALVLAPADEER